MARDYYGLLGVSKGASDSEIKRAYRKLARELHPDVNPDEGAQARFQEISVAYEVLNDPEKRRIVDLGGDPMESAAAGGGGGFAGFGGLGDVFEAFFGGGATSRGPVGRVRPWWHRSLRWHAWLGPPLGRTACGWVRSGRPPLGRRTFRRTAFRRSAFGICALGIRRRAALRRRARRKPLGCPHE